MHSKISTGVRTGILIIIALTVGVFVWVYEKGQDWGVVTVQTPVSNKASIVKSVEKNPEAWVDFDSLKDTQLNVGFSFQHPSSWMQTGNADGGSGSTVAFFEKDKYKYAQTCTEKDSKSIKCRDNGLIARVTVNTSSFVPAKIEYDNESKNNITVDGYPAIEISGIVKAGTEYNGFITESGQKEARVVVQNIKGLRFELAMLIKDTADEAVFGKILKTLKFEF